MARGSAKRGEVVKKKTNTAYRKTKGVPVDLTKWSHWHHEEHSGYNNRAKNFITNGGSTMSCHGWGGDKRKRKKEGKVKNEEK